MNTPTESLARRGALVLLSLLAAGCGKESGEHKRLPEALSHAPAGTAVLAHVSLAPILTLEPVRRVLAEQLGPQAMNELEAECGASLADLVSSVTIAATGDLDPLDGIVAVQTVRPRAEINACIARVTAKVGQDPVTPTDDGAITAYEQPETTEYAAWPADRTMLLAMSGLEDRAALDRAMMPGEARHDALLALYRRVPATATIWAVADLPPDSGIGAWLSDMPVISNASAIYAYATLDDGLVARIGATLPRAEDATGAAGKLTELVENARNDPMTAPYVDRVRVSTEGADLVVDLELTAAQLQLLQSAL